MGGKPIKDANYLARVRALPCIIGALFPIAKKHCWGRTEAHHKTGAGMGRKASDYDTMPLCFNHHSAQTRLAFGHSVHKGQKTFEATYMTQEKLIAETRRMLEEET